MTFCTIWIYCNIYLFNFTKDISICLIFKPFQQQTLHISYNLSFISIFANIIHICQFEYSHPNSYVIVNFEDIFQYQLLQYKQRFGLQSTDRFSGDLHWQPEWPLAWGSGPACHCTLDCNFMLYQCSWHHTAILVGKNSSYNDMLAAQGQRTQLVHKASVPSWFTRNWAWLLVSWTWKPELMGSSCFMSWNFGTHYMALTFFRLGLVLDLKVSVRSDSLQGCLCLPSWTSGSILVGPCSSWDSEPAQPVDIPNPKRPQALKKCFHFPVCFRQEILGAIKFFFAMPEKSLQPNFSVPFLEQNEL